MNASANILTGAEAPGLFTARDAVETSACASAAVISARVRAVNIAMVMEAASMMKSKRKRTPLPPACRREGCVFGWIDSPDRGGYQRCDCPRGRALAQGAKFGKKLPPKHDSRMEAANDV